jgi:lysyl-tRNA synthetase class I
MQDRLYELAKAAGLQTPDGKVTQAAFAAIYSAFIGKPKGPRAGWLLVSLEPDFVRRRLGEAADARGGGSPDR